MRSRLVLVDGGPVLKLLELSLQSVSLTPKELDEYLDLFWPWVRSCGWCPLIADMPGQARNITVIAVDRPPYWRTDYYAQYKSTRSPKTHLYKYLQESMEAHCATLGAEGFEADDVIAYLSRLWHEQTSHDCWIATVDHDLFGLVNDRTHWLGLRGNGLRQCGPAEVYQWLVTRYPKERKRRQKYWPLPTVQDFVPSDIWEWKAIVAGDRSDSLAFPNDSLEHPELISLFRWLIRLDKPAISLPEDPLWTQDAIESAKVWNPTHDYRDLDLCSTAKGLPFPFSPIPAVPPTRYHA